jgi:beta-galactosidase
MGNPPANIHRWRAAGLDRLERRLRAFEVRQINKKIIEVRTHAWLCAAGKNTGIESEIVYRVYGNGEVVLDNKVLVDQQLPFIPRVGLELVLPGEYEQLAWYGRGPHENYIDRKKGAALGRYKSTVADQFTPYVYPSECGGKEDVRWLALTDRDGAGLMVIALDQLHVDALHYTIQDLEEARHLYALKPRQEVILHLDGWHMGVGGDDGWAAQVHQEFLIFPGKYRFALRLKPINPQGDPAALGRTQIEGVF